ncbi:MAG: hypothetical protein HY700_21070 [Gemmatimonadetes bacterium]|nr:hypothetical protein [Gemmatimonadota bacterium]
MVQAMPVRCPARLLLLAFLASACEPGLKPFTACYTTHGPDGPPNDLSFSCRENDRLQLWSDGRYEVTFRKYSTWSNRLYVWEESGAYRFDRIRAFPSADGPTLRFAFWLFTPASGEPRVVVSHIAHPYTCDLDFELDPLPGRDVNDPVVQAQSWHPEGPYRLCLPE